MPRKAHKTHIMHHNKKLDLITCSASTGQGCPQGFKCEPSKIIGHQGHCLPKEHQKPLGRFSYQCTNLGCDLVEEHPGEGRSSSYEQCEKNCSRPASLHTYYECGDKLGGVPCDGPHAGFPNAKKGRFASFAQCRESTACGKARPTSLGHYYECGNKLGGVSCDGPHVGDPNSQKGRYASFAQCQESTVCGKARPTSLGHYYECGGKQGVACDGPHVGDPFPQKGKYASLAQCQESTVCGKARPVKLIWPSWDTGVGAANPFNKIMANVGNIHDPVQNYMGEKGHGPQSTHFYRPGLAHQQ